MKKNFENSSFKLVNKGFTKHSILVRMNIPESRMGNKHLNLPSVHAWSSGLEANHPKSKLTQQYDGYFTTLILTFNALETTLSLKQIKAWTTANGSDIQKYQVLYYYICSMS